MTGATAPPDPSIANTTYSARWSGKVTPKTSETYTFYTTSDDGVRLWVNGTQIINNWTDHGPTENSGTIALTAGTPYDLKLEYSTIRAGGRFTFPGRVPASPRPSCHRAR